jgi:PAS domain S-box-containing protein
MSRADTSPLPEWSSGPRRSAADEGAASACPSGGDLMYPPATLVALAPAPSGVLSLQGEWLHANDRLARLLGWEPGDPAGRRFQDSIEPAGELRAGLDALDRGLVDEWVGEARLLRADGATLRAHVAMRAVLDPSGTGTPGVVVVVHDQTALRERESALARRVAELEQVLDGSPDIITRFDRSLRHTYVNSAVTRATGLPSAHFIGRSNRELGMSPDLVEEWEGGIRHVFETGEVWETTFEFPGPDGEARHFWGRLAPELDAEGRVVSVLGVTRDETDRKLEQAAAFEAERRYQALMAALAGAATPEEVVHAATVFGGASVGSTIGSLSLLDEEERIFTLVPGPGVDGDVALTWQRYPNTGSIPVATAARTREPCYSRTREELVGRDPSMGPISILHGVHADASLPLLAGGRVLGVLSFAFTEPKEFGTREDAYLRAVAEQCALALDRARLHQAERDARQAAEQANHAKSRFLATMSHELRTPLNAIAGYVDLLDLEVHGPVMDAQRQALERITVAQRHLLSLINELLEFARIEGGHLTLDLKPVLVADVLRTAVPLVTPQIEASGLEFIVRLPEDAESRSELRVWADEEKLAQVVVNLVTNAIKFTPSRQADGARGKILLELAGDQGSADLANLYVRDTGVGIAPERLSEIFEPFVQLSTDLTRTHQGVGLGLSIARELICAMGGTLGVSSEPGKGSIFTVTLRRVRPGSPPPVAAGR